MKHLEDEISVLEGEKKLMEKEHHELKMKEL